MSAFLRPLVHSHSMVGLPAGRRLDLVRVRGGWGRASGCHYTTTAEAAAQPVPATTEPTPAKKEKKKKKEKEKKEEEEEEEKKASSEEAGPKLHVKRKLCTHRPRKQVWVVVGDGRLLEFEFPSDDVFSRPSGLLSSRAPTGPESEKIAEAYAILKKLGKKKIRKSVFKPQ